MEGRRIEGVFLDTTLLRNRAHEAYEASRSYEIKVVSQVPEALLSSFNESGSQLRAFVRNVTPQTILMSLENGFELEAQNRLSMPVNPGDELTLTLESRDPMVLRVERTFSGMRGIGEVIQQAVSTGVALAKAEGNLTEEVSNSGLFYEKKVWDVLKGLLSSEDLSKDVKYNLLKTLESADLSRLADTLKNLKLPPDLKEFQTKLLNMIQKGESKVEFFKEFSNFMKALNSFVASKEVTLSQTTNLIRSINTSLISLLTRSFENLGVEFTIASQGSQVQDEAPMQNLQKTPDQGNPLRSVLSGVQQSPNQRIEGQLSNTFMNLITRNQQAMESLLSNPTLRAMISNPRTIAILEEAVNDLEVGKFNGFVEKLRLVGIEIKNPEVLPQVREDISRTIRDLVRGANAIVSSQTEVEDLQDLAQSLRKTREEVEELHSAVRDLSTSLPREVKESLSRLETLTYLQSFIISQNGKGFILPFEMGEDRGSMAFLLKDSFRVFVRLNFKEGFLGIVVESPRKENPEFLNVVFKTDIEVLRREIERDIDKLRREIEELGLEVRRIEVMGGEEEEFNREVVEEFGEKSLFNLRV